MSTSSTRRCSRARKAERLMDVMVFPHPPFWFTTAIVRIHAPSGFCVFSLLTRLDTSKRLGQIATNPWGRRPSGTPYIGGWNVPWGLVAPAAQGWPTGAGLDRDVESSHIGSMADPYVDRRDQMFPKLT